MGAPAWLTGHRAQQRDRAPAHEPADASLTRHKRAQAVRRDAALPTPQTLRPRELETLLLMCRGTSKKAIAIELGVSEHVVNDYQKALYVAFDVHSALALVAAAFNTGFVQPTKGA